MAKTHRSTGRRPSTGSGRPERVEGRTADRRGSRVPVPPEGARAGAPLPDAEACPPSGGPNWIAGLERNLRLQIEAEERLLSALDAQRESMRRLVPGALTRSLDAASAAVSDIAQLQTERRRLLGGVNGGPPASFDGLGMPRARRGAEEDRADGGEASSGWARVLERAPADARGRLASLRRRARDLAERVARTNGVNRRVTERARAHFAGLLETLAGGGSATYEPRRGSVAVSPGSANALIDRVA